MVQERIVGRGPTVIGSHPTRCPNCGHRMTFRIFQKRKPSNLFASAHCRSCAMKFQVLEQRPGAFPPTWNPEAHAAASEAARRDRVEPTGAPDAAGGASRSTGGASEAPHEQARRDPVQRTGEPERPAETTESKPERGRAQGGAPWDQVLRDPRSSAERPARIKEVVT